MEILIVLGVISLLAVNAPVEIKAPQEIKSSSTSVEVVQPVKPKAKPQKKKVAKKVVQADPVKQQITKEPVKKETAKAEPVKKETAKAEPVKKEPPTTVSSPEQKSNQSNPLYYILGIITLGLVSAYFYFRKGSQTADKKVYTSDELKKSLKQESDKFKYQPPDLTTETQSQSSSDPSPASSEPQSQSSSDPNPEPKSQTPSSDQTLADPKPDDEGKKS
jgi:hypothetical protein